VPGDTTHEAFGQPSDQSVTVWRYMDFAKYVATLKSRALYFARVDLLGDPFEGSLSKSEFDHWKKVAQDGEARGDLPAHWKGKYFEVLLGNARRTRRQCYASCWHMNPVESEAMWRLYSNSGYAICITSTYQALAASLPADFSADEHRGPFLGVVHYTDHDRDMMPTGNAFHAIMHKRSSFSHERECRAVLWRVGAERWVGGPPEEVLATYPPGIEVPVALESLIHAVVISPAAPTWFSDTVADLTKRYGFQFKLTTSTLTAKPYL
jgi:hypothetical protein